MATALTISNIFPMPTRSTTRTTLDDARWQQVLARDAAADGNFFYAVSTTGVYCRPSCASRRPRRENVSFFASVDAAKHAGFRACERCRPDAPVAETELVARAVEIIEREEPATAAAIALQAGVSMARLERAFVHTLGVSVKKFAAARRLEKFRRALQQESVTEAIYTAGFASSSRLYDGANAKLGMTPTKYKRGGDGEVLRYATSASTLGRMLVATTARGICAISFGDEDAVLLAELRSRFPRAEILRDERALKEAVHSVSEHLREPARAFALPLDLRATAFQQRVWQALTKIPAGQTRSYAQVAQSLGQPKATRAVARACAGNPVAVVVPCHRVVASDGKLTGYRWGIARKKQLLAAESLLRKG